MRFALILPACNEAEALPWVVRELGEHLRKHLADGVIAVGANGCTDSTARIARDAGVVVGETARRGYGHGCVAAIAAVRETHPEVEAYLFLAADGANDPADLPKLIAAYEAGFPLVLGQRTRLQENITRMTAPHVVANRVLGAWCGVLTGRFFCDLGPFRLISRSVFEVLEMREWTYGWTIEAQILCARLGVPMAEINVRERARVAGEQKVSHVSWKKTLSVGCEILLAGWRSRFRPLKYNRFPCPTPKTLRLNPKDSPHLI